MDGEEMRDEVCGVVFALDEAGELLGVATGVDVDGVADEVVGEGRAASDDRRAGPDELQALSAHSATTTKPRPTHLTSPR